MIDLTKGGETEEPSVQWANKRLETARLQRQCVQMKEQMRDSLLLQTSDESLRARTDFAAFPSTETTRAFHNCKPVLVGRISVPTSSVQAQTRKEEDATKGVEQATKNLLGALKKQQTTANASKVVLQPVQLRHIHSLLL